MSAFVEGNSINAKVRMTHTAKHTVLKLLADLGKVCTACQDQALRNLPCKRIQLRGTSKFDHTYVYEAIHKTDQ